MQEIINTYSKKCYACNENEVLFYFHLKGRSIDDVNTIFDGHDFTITLCRDCVERLGISEEWFDNEKDYDYSYDRYKHEMDILFIIENMDIESKELIYNVDNELTGYKKIPKEDWINLNT